MKVRGTIKCISIEKNQSKSKNNTTIIFSIKATLEFTDIIKWTDELLIFKGQVPEKLDKWKDEKFDFSDYSTELLYRLQKDKQFIEIEFDINKKIKSLEIIND